MKKLMIALLLVTGAAFSQNANAQINVSINIGSQPAWGPSGYNRADFYYIPAINTYYDIGRCQYVYMNGNSWIYASQLPRQYRNFDLYHSYKVVVNRPAPYRNNRNDIAMYGRYRNVYNQPMNRDNRNYRNYANNGHNNNWNNNDRGHNGYAGNNWDNRNDRGHNGNGNNNWDNGNDGHGNHGNNGNNRNGGRR